MQREGHVRGHIPAVTPFNSAYPIFYILIWLFSSTVKTQRRRPLWINPLQEQLEREKKKKRQRFVWVKDREKREKEWDWEWERRETSFFYIPLPLCFSFFCKNFISISVGFFSFEFVRFLILIELFTTGILVFLFSLRLNLDSLLIDFLSDDCNLISFFFFIECCCSEDSQDGWIRWKLYWSD